MAVPRSGWFLRFEGAVREFEYAIDELIEVVRTHSSELIELGSGGWAASVGIDIDPRIGYAGPLFTAIWSAVNSEAGLDVQIWIPA